MRYKKFAAAVMAAGFLLSGGVFLGGCGSSQQAAGQKQAIKVTTFKPFKSDTPIMREYTGSIMALQEVPVRSKVSGTVMEKYITGGQQVTEGQPLYRLDTRNYSSQLANAQAQAAQAAANYENAATDLARYDQLIAAGAPEICLKDMAGIGQPAMLGELVRRIKEKHPDIIIQYHGHSGPGL